MTPREYFALMKGHSYKVVDARYDAHMQSWLDQQVQATKKTGKKGDVKPVYESFKDFFDYEKELKNVEKSYVKEPISKEKVERFRSSVAEVERLMNEGR